MKPLNQKHRQHGLTLIELMVSITIGIVLMAGIMQIFASSKQSYKMQDTLTYLQESGRFSIDLISKDLRRAGYWGPNGQIMK
jgi:type IV pilus assembly protein PilW